MNDRRDARIRKKVIEAVEKAGLFSDCDLEIAVENGVVGVEGTAPTESRAEEVLLTVGFMEGVAGLEFEVHVLQSGNALTLDRRAGEEEEESLEARKMMVETDPLEEFGEEMS